MANKKLEERTSLSIGIETRLPKAINQGSFAAEKAGILNKSMALADGVVPYLTGPGSAQFVEAYSICSDDTNRLHTAVVQKISQDSALQQYETVVFLLGGYLLMREITEHQREIHAIPDKFDPQVPPDLTIVLDRKLEDVVRHDEYANSGVLYTVLNGGALSDFRTGRSARPVDSLRFFVENSPFISEDDDLTFDDFIGKLKMKNQTRIDKEFPQLSFAMISNAILLLNKALRVSRQDIEAMRIHGSATTREVLQKGIEFVTNLMDAQANIRHVVFNLDDTEEYNELVSHLETYLLDERYWRAGVIALGIEPSDFVRYYREADELAQKQPGNFYKLLALRIQMYASETPEAGEHCVTFDKLTAILDKGYDSSDEIESLDWTRLKSSVETIRQNTSREGFVVDASDISIDKGDIKKPSKIELLVDSEGRKIRIKLTWPTDSQLITLDLDFDIDTQEFDWSLFDNPNTQDLKNELKRVRAAAFDAVGKIASYVERDLQYQEVFGKAVSKKTSGQTVYKHNESPYPGSKRISGSRHSKAESSSAKPSRRNTSAGGRKGKEEAPTEVVIQGKIASRLRGVDPVWVPIVEDALNALAASGTIKNRDSYTHIVTTSGVEPDIAVTLKRVGPGIYRINSIKPYRNGH